MPEEAEDKGTENAEGPSAQAAQRSQRCFPAPARAKAIAPWAGERENTN